MLNGKKRAYLRSLANTTKPTSQIGKEGITQDFLDQLEDQLRTRELVKVTILDNAGIEAKEAANAICAEIRAEFVQAIGSKFTIYKKNNENPKIFSRDMNRPSQRIRGNQVVRGLLRSRPLSDQ